MTLRFSLFLWLWRKEARCCRPHSCISIQPCLLFLSSALHVYTALLVSLFSCCLVEWAFCLEVWGCLCEETGFFARLIDDIWACLWPRIVFIVHCPSFCSIVCTDTCQYLVSTDWTVMHYHLAFSFLSIFYQLFRPPPGCFFGCFCAGPYIYPLSIGHVLLQSPH